MTLLQVEHLGTAYGPVTVNRDVSLTVGQNEIVTILGPNGAGKSTLLRAISGLLKPRSGSIRFDDRDVTNTPADRAVGLGIIMVPEGRKIFADMTVRENLRLGAYARKDRDAVEEDVKLMESYFEILAQKRGAKGGERFIDLPIRHGPRRQAVRKTAVGTPEIVTLRWQSGRP